MQQCSVQQTNLRGGATGRGRSTETGPEVEAGIETGARAEPEVRDRGLSRVRGGGSD